MEQSKCLINGLLSNGVRPVTHDLKREAPMHKRLSQKHVDGIGNGQPKTPEEFFGIRFYLWLNPYIQHS